MPSLDVRSAAADTIQKITPPPPKEQSTAAVSEAIPQQASLAPPVHMEQEITTQNVPVILQVGMPNADPADRRVIIGK